MYADNKYTRWYYNIIENSVPNGYTEIHHIVPKSLGGDNSDDNLVKLTAREHYICHLLLPKMVSNADDRVKMIWALWRMSNGRHYAIPSKQYERNRSVFIETMMGHENWCLGHSEEAKKKISEASKNHWKNMSADQQQARIQRLSSPESWTEERKRKISDKLKGKLKSTEHRKNMSAAKKEKMAQLDDSVRLAKYGSINKGKTWTLVDGKRVWVDKETTND